MNSHQIDFRKPYPEIFGSTPEFVFLRVKSGTVLIEDDVFAGMYSLILKGVTICRGSIIGADSGVTKSVPSYGVAGGNPAKVLRSLIDNALA